MNSVIDAQLEMKNCIDEDVLVYSSSSRDVLKAFEDNLRLNSTTILTYDPNELLDVKSIIV